MDRLAIIHGLIDLLTHKASYQQSSSGLLPQDMQLLERIGMSENVPTLALARRSGFAPATAIAILDRLQAKGYIDRVRDDDDRRVVEVSLTQAGRRLIELHLLEDQAFVSNFFGTLSKADGDLLAELLVTVLKTIDHEKMFAAPSGPGRRA